MSISQETLRKIAHLSRLELPEEQLPKMQKEFSAMVGFVEQLRRVDTEGVEPLTTMTAEINAFRSDVVSDELPPQEVFRNAPAADGTYFRVPKVIG